MNVKSGDKVRLVKLPTFLNYSNYERFLGKVYIIEEERGIPMITFRTHNLIIDKWLIRPDMGWKFAPVIPNISRKLYVKC